MQKTFFTPYQTLAFLTLLLIAMPSFAGWPEGVAAFSEGRYETAENEFRSFVEKSPEAADAHYMLGLTLQRQKRYDEALASMTQAVDLGGANRHRLAQSQVLLQLNRADDALAALTASKGLAQELRAGYGQLLATAASQATDRKKALQALNDAAKADPKARHLHMARASVAHETGDRKTEIAALTRAYDLEKADPQPIRRAFQVAMHAGDHAAAFATAKHWSTQAEESIEALTAAGEARMAVKDYAGARSWFEKAAAPRPNHVPESKLVYYIGACYLAEGNGTLALEALADAETRADAELLETILMARGSAYHLLEQYEKAASVYREVGADEKVAEMEGLIEATLANNAWDEERKQCLRKKSLIETTRAEIADLEGTPEWNEAEAEFAEILAVCEPYLEEQG